MKYGVYTLNGSGSLYEVQYLTSSKEEARSYMQSLQVIYDPHVITFDDSEVVPALMEIE